jgi:hypothetical protein
MTIRPQVSELRRVEPKSVPTWFMDAWPDEPKYPTPAQCSWVAARINVIIDQLDADKRRKPSQKELLATYNLYAATKRLARALKRLIPSLSQDLELRSYSYLEGEEECYNDPETHAACVAVRSLENGLNAVLALPDPPKTRQYQDNYRWIADAAVMAWKARGVTVRLGNRSAGPLVAFVRLALEHIGLAKDGDESPSYDTISEHLRGRSDRPRSGRAKQRGAKRSDIAPHPPRARSR